MALKEDALINASIPKLKYDENAIRSALILLDNIQIKGIDNAKRIVQIEMILQNPLKEDKDDGSHKV